MPSIIINGRKVTTACESMTYQDIVDLADSGRSPSALHSIVYSTRRQGDSRRSGSVCPGETLAIEDGMVITALVTDGA